ncbi:tryptophan-rich sensory protein [Nocardioides sp. TRM66260-LWL]|uniref:TspO/MBR family protein n=1 Tax=Nocardioides sp. TRM66260-LWL TaxID=2874478 RepID=UPI001CC5922D|nr:TspO/MBR family protein [Nocardioides sp. TRM66260-LWL]MBZ5732890.1 tryptophan-rich sensory protein [Nocardioides sp. TRM66260-LWL]
MATTSSPSAPATRRHAPDRGRGWLGLVPFLLAVALVSAVGGLAASSSQETYRALELPPYAPPSWVFGPVWTVLYVTIAVAGWLAWRAGAGPRELSVWGVQLLLNLAWTPLFFAAGEYRWALVEIVALLASVVATVVVLGRVRRAAGLLLLPYLAWVAFATALNAGIVVLN